MIFILSLLLIFILGIILLILFSAQEGKNRKWYLIFGIFGVMSPVIIPIIFIILFVVIGSSNTPLSYWLGDRLYFWGSKTVGNPSIHEVKNQKGEVKEVFDQKDVISASKFQLEVIKTGYDESGKYKKDIDSFLRNSGINKGTTVFVDKYCFAEFKITNLVTHGYRTDGRSIRATRVESENQSNLDQITFYPSNDRNNNDMDDAGDWKTGVVAFNCNKTNNSKYLISFSSCSLRGGCGDENENGCLGNPSCPYKSYEEYIRDIKFNVLI